MCAHSNKIQPDGVRLHRKTAVYRTNEFDSFIQLFERHLDARWIHLDSSRFCRAHKIFRPKQTATQLKKENKHTEKYYTMSDKHVSSNRMPHSLFIFRVTSLSSIHANHLHSAVAHSSTLNHTHTHFKHLTLIFVHFLKCLLNF